MKKIFPLLLLLVASVTLASAQAPAASAREDLSGLPESQAVVFINTRRITNEVLPTVVPASKYEETFDTAKKMANVDVRQIDYLLAGVCFTDAPSSGVVPVEFGVIVRGGFNADALLSMARVAGQGKYREETRGGKSISIFRMDADNANKDAAKDTQAGAQQPKLPQEIAAVSLGADSVLIGTPAYVAAALEARGGAGTRIKTDLVDLAMRDANALVSVAGVLPPSVSKLIDPPGGKGFMGDLLNDEMKRLIDSVRQGQLSVNLAAAQFGSQVALRTDTPENARAISGLIATGLNAVLEEARKDAATRKNSPAGTNAARALDVLKSITNTVRDNEVTLSVSVPQAMVASFAREAFAPPTAPKKQAQPAARPTRRTRTPARRRA